MFFALLVLCFYNLLTWYLLSVINCSDGTQTVVAKTKTHLITNSKLQDQDSNFQKPRQDQDNEDTISRRGGIWRLPITLITDGMESIWQSSEDQTTDVTK